jgi:hypothetical protein
MICTPDEPKRWPVTLGCFCDHFPKVLISSLTNRYESYVLTVLGFGNSAPLASTPVWARDFASPEELITEFSRECRIVRKGFISAYLLCVIQFQNLVVKADSTTCLKT